MSRLHIADAFGWETVLTGRVALAQVLEDPQNRYANCCPGKLLAKNIMYQEDNNEIKICGYIPLLNIIAGAFVLNCTDSRSNADSGNLTICRPYNRAFWIFRGVAMILAGPLLLVVDLIKFCFDLHVAKKYAKEQPENTYAFDVDHFHYLPYSPNLSVSCARPGDAFDEDSEFHLKFEGQVI